MQVILLEPPVWEIRYQSQHSEHTTWRKSCLNLQHYAIVCVLFVYNHDGQNKTAFERHHGVWTEGCEPAAFCWLCIKTSQDGRRASEGVIIIVIAFREFCCFGGAENDLCILVNILHVVFIPFEIITKNNACKHWNVSLKMSLCLRRIIESIFSSYNSLYFNNVEYRAQTNHL